MIHSDIKRPSNKIAHKFPGKREIGGARGQRAVRWNCHVGYEAWESIWSSGSAYLFQNLCPLAPIKTRIYPIRLDEREYRNMKGRGKIARVQQTGHFSSSCEFFPALGFLSSQQDYPFKAQNNTKLPWKGEKRKGCRRKWKIVKELESLSKHYCDYACNSLSCT